MSFAPWQWAVLVAAAAISGFSKTGIPGISILSVGLFALVIPARQSTGVVLPLLIFADLFAYGIYRRHLEWKRVWLLLPWAVVGLAIGWFTLGHVDNRQAARLIGAIILLMVGIHVARRRWRDESLARAPGWMAPVMGAFAGVTTMMANAAGPVMSLYLLAMRLPKLEFLGTSAAFFLLINWLKVPLILQLGLIDASSLRVNLMLLPAVAVGALLGRPVVQRLRQTWFENVVFVLTVAAALRLLLA